MTVKTTILKDVAIVIPAITVWTGAKKLEPSDFINIDKHDLPSNRVASLGIKHLIDKERLTPFRSVRSKIDRLCASYGTRLMGGFAIPLDVVAKVSCELSDLCREFEDEIDKFIGQYDEAINDWIQQNPDFEVPLRRAMLSSNEVRRRFHADFAIFEVSASEMDKSNSLERVSDSLLTSVLNDAAKVMVALSGRSSKPTYYREAARIKLRELSSKLKRFAFADTTNGGLVWLAEAIETEVAGSGSLLEEEKDKLYAFVSKLTTADAILAAMQSKTMSGLKSQPAHESNNNNADTVVAHTATKETSVEEREINGETAVAAEPEPEKVDGEAENENVGETTESQETDEFPAFSLDPHFTENDETSPEDMPHKENVVPSAPIDAFDATFDF